MADETRQLAQFVLDQRNRDISVDLRRRSRCFVLDALANGLLGTRQSCFRIGSRAFADFGGSGSAHVFGSSNTTDASRASFLNGLAIHGFESDHNGYDAHPAGAVFPAVLAAAEVVGASGSAVLQALITGYEVNLRVSAALTNQTERVRGFHNPAVSGPFGSAAGCALLFGLSLDQTLAAFGIAGSHAYGLMEWSLTGAMTKRMHLGRAAQMGLEAVLLAREGFTGPPTILEGSYGLLQAYSPEPDLERLTDGLGSQFLCEDIRVKPYPGHSAAQPFVPVFDAWHALGIDATRIDEVRIATSERGAEKRFQDIEPVSVLKAQYSLPYTAAVALSGGIDALLNLDETTLEDDALSRLAARVSIVADSRFQGSPLTAGGEIQIAVEGRTKTLLAPGIPQYPTDLLRDVCRSKLERFAGQSLSADRISQIEDAVEAIEALSSILELSELVFT